MKAALPSAGRVLFGLAVVGLGLVGLAYADFVNSLQPVPAGMPGYRALAILNGLVLLAIGLAITTDRHARGAAIGIALFLGSWIALLHVPSAFADPSLLRSPWWIRTFESLALIGGAITLAGSRTRPPRDRWIARGRVAFGLSLPVFGVLHLVYPESVAALVPPWYPWPLFWAWFTGFAQIGAGLAIAVGIWARPAAILAGAMYGGWFLTLHAPRIWCRLWGPCDFLDAPVGFEAARGGLTSLCVALGMCGAAWLVAGASGKVPGSDG